MSRLYRPNAAAIITNREGMLLVCERGDRPGCFQFPQGGVDEGESSREALLREVWEEVGYDPRDYEVLESRSGYRYDYPREVLELVEKKRSHPYVGQEQTYFLCCLHPECPDPLLDEREFTCYKWIEPESFDLNWLPSFKREVYRRVMKDFFSIDLVC